MLRCLSLSLTLYVKAWKSKGESSRRLVSTRARAALVKIKLRIIYIFKLDLQENSEEWKSSLIYLYLSTLYTLYIWCLVGPFAEFEIYVLEKSSRKQQQQQVYREIYLPLRVIFCTCENHISIHNSRADIYFYPAVTFQSDPVCIGLD